MIKYLSLLRVYQWPKNLLIFVALITSQSFSLFNLQNLFISFLCFCFAASAGYIFNDLLDYKSDQLHHIKKNRMIARGIIKINEAITIIIILLSVSLSMSLFIDNLIQYIILYLLLSFLYSLYFKKIPWFDCFNLSILYFLRVFAGGIIIGSGLSLWLSFFSVTIFLSLSFMKRYSDVLLSNDQNNLDRRGYKFDDLKSVYLIGNISGYISTIILLLYFFSDRGIYFYNTKIVLFTIPIIIFWIWWMWKNTKDNKFHDPLLFLYNDKISLILGFTFSTIILISTYLT